MAVMRAAISLIVFLLSTRFLAAADDGGLGKIEAANRFFDLRRALEATGGDQGDTRYYRALIESRFGREEAAVDHFRQFLADAPDERMKRKALGELAGALLRLGRYGEAAAASAQALQLLSASDPERGPAGDLRAVCDVLKNVSPQSVEFGPDEELTAQINKLGLWSIPVEANGRRSQWIIDTGMTFSTVTESEAKRVGLEVQGSGGRGGSDHTGRELPFRLAVASDLRIGPAHLRNVVFAVVADHALQFRSFHAQGMVGLPAIRALGSIGFSDRGVVQIHTDSTRVPGDPNLLFDGLNAIVEVRHAGRTAPMKLDTGGDKTYLYSSFRDRLTPDERARLKGRQEGFTGVGGSIRVKTELVPQLELDLPGGVVTLRDVRLRLDSPPVNGPSEGLLGMDVLKGGFTIDFGTMRLALH